jgi:hypothetical protein
VILAKTIRIFTRPEENPKNPLNSSSLSVTSVVGDILAMAQRISNLLTNVKLKLAVVSIPANFSPSLFVAHKLDYN